MDKLIRRYNSLFRPLPSLIPSSYFDLVEDMFKDLEVYNPQTSCWKLSKGFPKGDVIMKEDCALIELALAGYSKEQLNITIEKNVLTISAKKTDEKIEESRAIARRSFTQDFAFSSSEYDMDKVKATFKDGLLVVVVPRTQQEQKGLKVISIE